MPKRKRVPSSSLGIWTERQKIIKQEAALTPPWEDTKSPKNKKNLLLSLPKTFPRPDVFLDLVYQKEFLWPCRSSLRQSEPSDHNLRKFPGPGKSGNVQARDPLSPLQQRDRCSRGSFLVGWGRCLCSWQISFKDVKS